MKIFREIKLFCDLELNTSVSRNFQAYNAQCGNDGNSLTRIFGKNFVKVTVLLNKLLKSDLTKYFVGEREFLVFPHCAMKVRTLNLCYFHVIYPKTC